MSFIPLIIGGLIISSECTMKYFIVQRIRSSILILGLMLMLLNSQFNYDLIITLSIIIKIGVAPFHTWILSLIEGLRYIMLFNLFTLIKIVPIIITININVNLNLLIIFRLILGSVFGLAQNSIRKILSYSSIFNIGFLIYSLSNFSLWFVYFFLYSINLFIFTLILNNNNINYLNQFMINKFDMKFKLSIWALILSSGGIPPIIGFWAKFIIIEFSISIFDWLISIIMIFTSLLTIFYYNRLCFVSMCISSLTIKWRIIYLSWLNLNVIIINVVVIPFVIISKYLS